MSCIGTAGHVDHGKSTLVTTLTGIDPDRLAEEKARGMTIDLGFAWLTLPSGREASIVDVPGHESFIKNMLAGVGGIDVALLVVAADEGVMPQTDEHLAILDLLCVRSGVVALTKCDLVEADWLEMVREEVSERLRPTTLAGAPLLPCSALTRAGVHELLAALDAALDAAPIRRDLGRPRLPIDRVFTITGFGTVVTGTLQDGSLRLGQEIEILPGGPRGRIRGLQTHKQSVEEGRPGGRLAVNLAGVTRSEIHRGDVLALPGRQRSTTALDVRLEVLAGAPRPVRHNTALDLYLGAAEVSARVVLLERGELRPGESGWAQLRLARPLVAVRGDRFIVRVPSPSVTIGGGVIVEPWARRHRARDAAVLARLEVLARGEPEEVVLAALRSEPATTKGRVPTAGKAGRAAGYGGRESGEIERATGLPAEEVAAALGALTARAMVIQISGRAYAATEWQRLGADGTRLLAEYHRQYPLRAGMPREEWRARLGLGPRAVGDVVAALVASGALAEVIGSGRGSYLKLPAFEARLSDAQERAVAAMLERFRREPFAPPTRSEVEEALGAEVTAALIEQGMLVKLTDAIVLERAAYDEAVRRIVHHVRTHGTLTVAEARDVLGTTRKYMLALFEHLDQRHITARQGDDRVLGPQASAADELASQS
ncbi:MAG: selenocysteine-specific translation elongation factor [Ktedonobacterales bacterium]|nr:selenocysteine-specific translation elongation factor [Ktedonobacterales bacterium]